MTTKGLLVVKLQKRIFLAKLGKDFSSDFMRSAKRDSDVLRIFMLSVYSAMKIAAA